MRFGKAIGFAAAGLLLSAGMDRADTVILKDGQQITGQVVTNDATKVVVETGQGGITIRKKYPKEVVLKVLRESKDGPSFYPLPILGPIGRNPMADSYVTAEAFEKALAEVEKAKPDYVVLVIDSPGGSVPDLMEMMQAINLAGKDLHFIAYVKHDAGSAAAILATACPTIVMAPGSTIGAAVPFKLGPDGTPQDIEEKFRSFVRAQIRAAEVAGHSPLLVRGMMEIDLQLALVKNHGKPEVIEGGEESGGKVLKRSGQILTLTNTEAAECGLSAGTVGDVEEIKSVLGLKTWHQAEGQAWYTIVNKAKAEHSEVSDALARSAHGAARDTYLRRVGPKLLELQSDIEAAQAKVVNCADTLRTLIQDGRAELAAADADYKSAVDRASQGDSAQYFVDRAKQEHKNKIAEIHGRYDSKIAEARREAAEALAEASALTDRYKMLLASAPADE